MTDLVVSGINYHSLPVAIRERFSIPKSCLKHALTALKHLPHILEAIVLSTCNRTEVFAVVSNLEGGLADIDSFFCAAQTIPDHQVLKPNFKLVHEDVALYLMRVASGLDSMILGEGQIMSQVKVAHQEALKAGTSGPILDGLFKLALSCGKRVRSETTMGQRAVSVSSAAVELAKKLLGNFEEKVITVIGLGKMGQICLKHLLAEEADFNILLCNRNSGKLQVALDNNLRRLNQLHVIENFSRRYEAIKSSDLVLVASSAEDFVLNSKELQAIRNSDSKPLYIIDIAVPRNVDPSIGYLSGINLFNADDLKEIVQNNLSQRETLVNQAEKIIFETFGQFQDWQRNSTAFATIAELREKVETIRKAHNSSKKNKVSDIGQIEKITKTLVNQILHQPTTRLKATKDRESLSKQTEALRALFDLEPASSTL